MNLKNEPETETPALQLDVPETFAEKALVAGWILFTLLLPFRFGTLLLPGVPLTLPENIWEFLFTSLPNAVFSIIAGVLLLLTLPLLWRSRNVAGMEARNAWLLALLYGIMPVVGAIGLWNASNLEFGIVELTYCCGLSCYALGIWILLRRFPGIRNWLLTTVAVTTLLAALSGLHQYWFGFDDLREYIRIQEEVYGIAVEPDLKARAFDVRASGPFTMASSLAGILLLTGGIAAWGCFRAGNRFEPVKLSRILFLLLGGGLLLFVFFATKGRSAFLALVIAALASGFLLIRSKKLQLLILLSGLAVIVAGAIYIQQRGRGFSSMAERVTYIETSLTMLSETPLLGAGWGEFTNRHGMLKSMGNHELAKDPHNMVLAWASQCGIPGGIWAVLLLLLPYWYGVKKLLRERKEAEKSRSWELFTVDFLLFLGITGYLLHTLMDLDFQVPALTALFALMQFLWLAGGETQPVLPADAPQTQRSGKLWILVLTAGALLAILAAGAGTFQQYGDQQVAKLFVATNQMPGTGNAQGQVASPFEVRRLAEASRKIRPYAAGIDLAAGAYFKWLGDTKEAIRCYERAQQLAPESWIIYAKLSELYDQQHETEKAKQFYEEAERRFPKNNYEYKLSFPVREK